MVVEVDLDLWVHLKFAWTEQWPMALMEEIRRQKVKIYQDLKPNPLEPDMLTAEHAFSVGGRNFRVIFAADRQRIDASVEVRHMRVIWIDEES